MTRRIDDGLKLFVKRRTRYTTSENQLDTPSATASPNGAPRIGRSSTPAATTIDVAAVHVAEERERGAGRRLADDQRCHVAGVLAWRGRPTDDGPRQVSLLDREVGEGRQRGRGRVDHGDGEADLAALADAEFIINRVDARVTALRTKIDDAKTKQRIDHLKNFGFVDEITVVAPGINGKMCEFNAALGLLQLLHIDQAIARRKEIDTVYREQLASVQGIYCLNDAGETVANHAYFPILVEPDYPLSRDALYQKLKDQDIYARRYFYPLISDFPMYRGMPSAQRGNLSVAAAASAKVLCLPIYPALQKQEQQRVIDIIQEH